MAFSLTENQFSWKTYFYTIRPCWWEYVSELLLPRGFGPLEQLQLGAVGEGVQKGLVVLGDVSHEFVTFNVTKDS